MPERTRPIRKEICLNETEWNIILQKMQQLRTGNFGAYARKMRFCLPGNFYPTVSGIP